MNVYVGVCKMGIREALMAQLGKAGAMAKSGAGAAGNTVAQVAQANPRAAAAAVGVPVAGAVAANAVNEFSNQPKLEPLGKGQYRMTVTPGTDVGDKIAEVLTQFGEPMQNEDGSLSFAINDGIMQRTGLDKMYADQLAAQTQAPQ